MDGKSDGFVVEPGEAAGMLAAQSVAEPITQMLLRSFHFGGMEHDVATSGLDRLAEILYARKKIARPITIIPLAHELERDEAEARKVLLQVCNAAGYVNTGKFKYADVQKDERGAFHIIAIGCLLGRLDKIEGIDHSRVYTNDIHGIFRKLGIEAARKAIAFELSKVFAEQGVTIHMRHLELIANAMTWSGEIEGIGSDGFMERKSVLARAADKKGNRHLAVAATCGMRDNLRGTVESILVGRQMPLGTGAVKLSIDMGAQALRDSLSLHSIEPEFEESQTGEPIYATRRMEVGKNIGCQDPMEHHAWQRLSKKKRFNAWKPEYLKSERNFYNAHPDLRIICGRLSLPEEMHEDVATLYRRCLSSGITNGRKTYAMAIAVISIICSDFGVRRDISSIAKEFNIKSSYLDSCVGAINGRLFNRGKRHEHVRKPMAKVPDSNGKPLP